MSGLSLAEVALLAVAGLAAGAVNAVAGGGSLVAFPALLGVGLPAVSANVTNAVAVLPGYLGGSIAYREELGGQRGRVVKLLPTTVAGGVLGAVLLLATGDALFEGIVPFLILLSCGLLVAQPAISRRIQPPEGARAQERSARLHALTFVCAVYGGYFGAGLGIALLAVLALAIEDDLQRLNALKGVLSLVIGLAAVAWFAFFGPVEWTEAAIVGATSLVGGQAGVVIARRLPATVLRGIVVAFGVGVALVLLIQR